MNKKLSLIAVAALIISILTGCASFYIVRIRSSDNRISVIAGGSIRFTASGRDIEWSVGSRSDGSGPVSNGTYIQNGLLMVAPDEPSLFLFVTATSMRDGHTDVIQVRIVTVTGVSVSAASQEAVAGRTTQFRAQVTGTNNPEHLVTWKVSSNASGTESVSSGTRIDTSGRLLVSQNEINKTLYVIATSMVDPTKSGSTSVTVVYPTVTNVTVTPVNQTVKAGTTQQFRAQVTGTYDPSQNVIWKVSSNITGTGAVTPGTSISSGGALTVANNESLSTLYVIAVSSYDQSKTGYVSVAIVVPVITSITVYPSNQSVRSGTAYQFSAAVTGTYDPPKNVTWKVSSNASGTGVVTPGTAISSNGILTVSGNESLSTLYIIATSVFDPTKSGNISVRVLIPKINELSVYPANPTVTSGRSQQFNAVIRGENDPDTTVIWSVSSNAAGTGAVTQGTSISSGGLLTVSPNETYTTLFVFAKSVFDPTKTGSTIVSVNITAVTLPAPVPTVTSVTVTPSNQSVQAGGSLQFNAAVSGTNNPSTAVTWRVSSNAAGTGAVTQGTSISSGGLLTVAANESLSTLYVFAASTADPTKSNSVSVNITRPVSPSVPAGITVNPPSFETKTNSQVQFSAAVTGISSQNVTWRVSSNAAGTGSVANRTTISANGLLNIAPNEWNRYLYVFASSAADSSIIGSAVVTVTNNNENQGPNQGN